MVLIGLPFKLKKLRQDEMTFFDQRPILLSFLLHGLFALMVLSVFKFQKSSVEMVQVPVFVSEPKEIQNLAEVKAAPKIVVKSVNEPVETAPSREVFGANKKSYTDSSVNDSEAVEAKRGNTLAKSADKTVLQDSDAESLPTPTEEYLVSEMPSVLSDVRPEYPKEAREKRIEGSVALDVLIDQLGKVRQASVIEGPEIFRIGAIEAIRKFSFRPAKVDGKAVAVRIRYSLKFQLEY